MRKRNIFIIVILIFSSVSIISAGGKQEEEVPVLSEKAESEATTDPDEVDAGEFPELDNYTESQEKLTHLGFDLPTEPFDAPVFTLPFMDEGDAALTDYRGKVVFLNFWASWCGPCRAEMPSMNVLYEKLPDNKFAMLAVNVNEPKASVHSFIDETGYTFPILLDETGEVSGLYGVQGIPTTWIIAPDGGVIARLVGTTEWDTPEMIEIFEFILENS